MKLPLVAAGQAPAPSSFDVLLDRLDALARMDPFDPNELRYQRRKRRRTGDPLDPTRLPVRQRERRLELALRRGEDPELVARRRQEWDEANKARGRARREATRARAEEHARLEVEHADLLAFYRAMPRHRRQVVARLAWVLVAGSWHVARPTGAQIDAHRFAVVEVMRSSPGVVLFPLVRVGVCS